MRPLILTLLLLATGCASNGIEKARKERLDEIQALKKGILERELELEKTNQKAVEKYQSETPKVFENGFKFN